MVNIDNQRDNFPHHRPQLGFWRVVSQDMGASVAAILGATMFLTAGVMLAKSGAGSTGVCAAIAALLAGLMAWRTCVVASRAPCRWRRA